MHLLLESATLKSFDNTTTGTLPYGKLLEGSDGNLYGTTDVAGPMCCGALFRLSKDGHAFTLLATFDGSNGSYPQSGLVEGPDGNFYGTTAAGGANNDGTVFRMTPSGQLTTLASFDRATIGSWLSFNLVVGSDGYLYGSTLLGGPYDNGTLFRLDTRAVALPRLVFNVSATTIALGQSATLSWSSQGADSCDAYGDWSGNVPPTGTRSVTPTTSGDHLYGLTCRNVAGSVSIPRHILVKRTTTISAKAEVLEVATTTVHLRMKAILGATSPVQPLAGKTVYFSAPNGAGLCSAVTDSTGTATCGDPTTYLRTVINQKYTATFRGDDAFLGSSATAGLVQ